LLTQISHLETLIILKFRYKSTVSYSCSISSC